MSQVHAVLVYWALAALGALLALVVGVWLQRTRHFTLFPSAHDPDSVRRTLVALLVFALLAIYHVQVDDAAHALAEPFASGAVNAMCAIVVLLLCVELLGYYLQLEGGATSSGTALAQRAYFSPLYSTNVTLALVTVAVVALDLTIFLHGYVLVALGAAALLAFALLPVYVLVPALGNARVTEPFHLYARGAAVKNL
jgi:hypothetical protein